MKRKLVLWDVIFLVRLQEKFEIDHCSGSITRVEKFVLLNCSTSKFNILLLFLIDTKLIEIYGAIMHGVDNTKLSGKIYGQHLDCFWLIFSINVFECQSTLQYLYIEGPI